MRSRKVHQDVEILNVESSQMLQTLDLLMDYTLIRVNMKFKVP